MARAGVRGGAPHVAGRYTRREASQGKLRSHDFFYKPEGSDSGLLGLPISTPGRPSFEHLFGESAAVLFLRNVSLDLKEVGELGARPRRRPTTNAAPPAWTWYGNARPLFLRGRVFALLGYELVEGALSNGSFIEARRISYDPTPRKTLRADASAHWTMWSCECGAAPSVFTSRGPTRSTSPPPTSSAPTVSGPEQVSRGNCCDRHDPVAHLGDADSLRAPAGIPRGEAGRCAQKEDGECRRRDRRHRTRPGEQRHERERSDVGEDRGECPWRLPVQQAEPCPHVEYGRECARGE